MEKVSKIELMREDGESSKGLYEFWTLVAYLQDGTEVCGVQGSTPTAVCMLFTLISDHDPTFTVLFDRPRGKLRWLRGDPTARSIIDALPLHPVDTKTFR